MGIGWLFLLLTVLWLIQLGLAYQQAQRFMARAGALQAGLSVDRGLAPPAARASLCSGRGGAGRWPHRRRGLRGSR